jgi:hypothetical protein
LSFPIPLPLEATAPLWSLENIIPPLPPLPKGGMGGLVTKGGLGGLV